jgi:hypothetical protein
MNTLELNNVELSTKVAKSVNDSTRELKGVDKLIDPVVQRLAVLNPLWRFVVEVVTFDNSTDPQSLKAVEFKVMEAGEELGTISREYHGRDYVIQISNERIGKDRVRRGGYKTKDADKAILKAKKMFFKLKPSERVDKATKDAGGVIQQQARRKDRERYNHAETIQTAAHKFIMGTGFSLFLEHIKTMTESERNKIYKAQAEHERIGEEMLTIEKVKSQFENGKTALVIKDDGKYLVKIGDAIQLYDDNTLPNDMRGKLGMLKLVEAEAFVSNTGCRINDEVFVLVVEEA